MQKAQAAGTSRATQSRTQNVLREFVFSVYTRKMLIIVIFVAVVLFALLMAIFLPPVYKATVKFTMTIPKKFDPLEGETAFDYKNFFRRQLNEQKAIILSNRVLTRVMEELNYGNLDDPSEWLEKLREKLEVVPPQGETFEDTAAFHINFEDRFPHRAARFAKSIADAYVDTFRSLAKEKTKYSYDFFKEQTQELYDKMITKERALRDFERNQALYLIEILNLGSGQAANDETGAQVLLTQTTAKYHDLQEQLAGLRVAIQKTEQQMRSNRIPVVMADMEVSGRAITVFKRKVAQLQIQLNEMRPRFRERFELMSQVQKELNLNIASLKRELGLTVKAKAIEAQAIEAKLAELDKVISDLKERVRVTAAERATYEQLQNDYNLAKDAYVSANNQLEQARLAKALNREKGTITLVDEPIVPDSPDRPNRVLIVILGLVAGVLLGVAAALTTDFFDHSVRTYEGIERHLDITILGTLPKMS